MEVAQKENFLPFGERWKKFKHTVNTLVTGKKKTHEEYKRVIDQIDISQMSDGEPTCLASEYLKHREDAQKKAKISEHYKYFTQVTIPCSSAIGG